MLILILSILKLTFQLTLEILKSLENRIYQLHNYRGIRNSGKNQNSTIQVCYLQIKLVQLKM